MTTQLVDFERGDIPHYKDKIKEDTLVKDRYYVLEKIGDGCYAKVFLVQDTQSQDGAIYALKAIRKVHFKHNRKLPYMLDKEAKIHGSLDHENIVKLHRYFEDKSYVFFLMDYISPGEIYPILYEEEGFSEEETADYFYQVVQALRFCQSKNVIHRDLKPENLLLTEDGEVKLADFGWATYKKGSSVVGSVHYNAPEMLKYQTYDFRSDIWSLGVILYELLCCQQPFRGRGKNDKDKEKATERIIKGGRFKISKYFEKLSQDAKDLISQILVLDPMKRLDYDQILAHPWMQKNAPQLNGERPRPKKALVQEARDPLEMRKKSRTRSIERSREIFEPPGASDEEIEEGSDPEEAEDEEDQIGAGVEIDDYYLGNFPEEDDEDPEDPEDEDEDEDEDDFSEGEEDDDLLEPDF